MKKLMILICCVSGIAFFSCRKNLTPLNIDPKNPTTVPSYTLFSKAQLNLANQLATPNVNTGIFELLAQYWQEVTYTDESNYDLVTRAIPNNWFHGLYRDVLINLQQAKSLIPEDVSDAVQQKNEIAMADIMQVYTWHYLVTTFGNIPYKEALDINNTQPKYDDAKTIYADLVSRLNTDIANLNTSGDSFGSADLLYGGDVAKWKKFANSFKLKMGILMADYDAAASKTAVESAVTAGVFTSNSDNALFNFLDAPPNTNPIWVNLVQSGRKDFVACQTILNYMVPNNDPRLPLYFTKDATGTGYSGLPAGTGGSYAAKSKPADQIVAPSFPYDFLDYAEVEFCLAEAVERGYAVTGTAAQHYNNAITASITAWGGSAAAAAAYLAQPSVAYATAAGNYKQKIGTQKWIALYNRGQDGWTEWRRLDYPVLPIATQHITAVIPVRYTYPTTEQNLNKSNWTSASSAIGGDDVATKLWFDKY